MTKTFENLKKLNLHHCYKITNEGLLYLSKEYKDDFDVFPKIPSLVIRWAQNLSVAAMEQSVEQGNGQFVTAEPGVMYSFGQGTVHQMQPFDQDEVHPARLSIEQYLIG